MQDYAYFSIEVADSVFPYHFYFLVASVYFKMDKETEKSGNFFSTSYWLQTEKKVTRTRSRTLRTGKGRNYAETQRMRYKFEVWKAHCLCSHRQINIVKISKKLSK